MISKMPGDYWQKFAGLRVSYGYMFTHPGKKLMFMGGEIGQFNEWSHEKSLDWGVLDFEMHRDLQKYIKDLNKLYKSEKALFEIDSTYEGFEWIDCNDADHGVISFLRKSSDWRDTLVIVCNYTPVVYEDYRIGVPFDVNYDELFNSDAECYGGSGVVNGSIHADQYSYHNKPYSLKLRISPLAVMVLKPRF
jgi:1,4-alpha-glucan branching enzyme